MGHFSGKTFKGEREVDRKGKEPKCVLMSCPWPNPQGTVLHGRGTNHTAGLHPLEARGMACHIVSHWLWTTLVGRGGQEEGCKEDLINGGQFSGDRWWLLEGVLNLGGALDKSLVTWPQLAPRQVGKWGSCLGSDVLIKSLLLWKGRMDFGGQLVVFTLPSSLFPPGLAMKEKCTALSRRKKCCYSDLVMFFLGGVGVGALWV